MDGGGEDESYEEKVREEEEEGEIEHHGLLQFLEGGEHGGRGGEGRKEAGGVVIRG